MGLFAFWLWAAAAFAALPEYFQPVLVDVLDDDLADNDDRHSQEHACGVQKLAAENDAEDDGNRVQIQGFADECRIDEVMIDLREDNVEGQRLQGEPGCLCCGQDRSKGGGDGRSEHRDEFADTGNEGENGGIGQAAQREIGEYYGGRDGTEYQLAGNIDAQGMQDAVEEIQHACIIFMREETCKKDLDLLTVLQQIEGDKKNDDEINELAKDRKDHAQRRFQGIDAHIGHFLHEAVDLIGKKIGIWQEWNVLQAQGELRQVRDEASEGRNEGTGNNAEHGDEQGDERDEHDPC